MKKRTVKARDCSIIAMCDGRGETTHSIVVDSDGNLKEYVGIGWITLRKATAADKRKYPQVV